MNTRDLNAQFTLIVNSLLSPQKIDPSIIQQHVSQYAKSAGISYELARSAVILKAKSELIKKLELI
jgi:hypothetical protein